MQNTNMSRDLCQENSVKGKPNECMHERAEAKSCPTSFEQVKKLALCRAVGLTKVTVMCLHLL